MMMMMMMMMMMIMMIIIIIITTTTTTYKTLEGYSIALNKNNKLKLLGEKI